jgi:muramoyltetrapeptide carboxypeptidase
MNEKIRPSYLKTGDSVAIIATARKISEKELNPALDVLKSWGLIPVLGKHIYFIENQFAGSDAQRTADLQWALDDNTIKAIIIVRGGYGTLRIIDNLDFTKFKKHPKWIVGYSDITVLHAHLQNIGYQSLHATMPINFFKHEGATQSLKKALFGEALEYSITAHPLNKMGEAKGILIGGNLSLLYAISGSASDLNYDNCILFIEDLDEYLYHIDRMMLQLKRSGKLAKLKGLIVGGMTDMKDNTVPFGKTAEEIILDAVKEYNYPVCFQFLAGHIDENYALVMGQSITMKVEANTSTIFYTEQKISLQKHDS